MKKLLIILISLMMVSMPVYGDTKSEVVYVVLDGNGESESSSVITYLEYDENVDVIHDTNYGSGIKNLTDQSDFLLKEGKVTFDLVNAVKQFNFTAILVCSIQILTNSLTIKKK